MVRWVAALAMFPLLGCSGDAEPAWAFDPIYVEPTDDGLVGFHTWEVFRDNWQKRQHRKHYLCSVVVEVQGEPAKGKNADAEECPGCEAIFSVSTTLLETDCSADFAQDERFVSLQRVAFGSVGPDLLLDDPWPGSSDGGFVDYGDGWEPHGWAYPAALDQGEAAVSTASGEGWDGETAVSLWPAFAWEL